LEGSIGKINLLGTGGGYGESLVIHIGDNEWIVVDSCIDPYTKKSLPLKYLQDNSIDLNCVKLIICTHWHDDHIMGLSDLLSMCPKALFSFARPNDSKKFLQLVCLDYKKSKLSVSNSSTVEFSNCLKILKERKERNDQHAIKYPSLDKLLYYKKFEDIEIEVYSLSPSELSHQLYDMEISKLITDFGPTHMKIIKQSPNDRSVVLLLKLGYHIILLGADLEVNNNPKLGWLDITSNSEIIKKLDKSGYFKIPHHGSENGYHIEIWDKLIKDSPISTITPWNLGTGLPTELMLKRYNHLSQELYMSSEGKLHPKPKKRDQKITKTIKAFNNSLKEIKYQFGVVSSTIDLKNKNSKWLTTCTGAACDSKVILK